MKKSFLLLILAALLLSACGAKTPEPQPALQATSTTAPVATKALPSSTPTELPPSATPEPSPTPTADITLFPNVTFTQTTVCRLGPDENYYKVVTFTEGQSSQAQGRSEDSAWLTVFSQAKNKSFTCWVPVANVKDDFGDVSALTVTIAPELPVGPSSATAERLICGNHIGTGPLTISWAPYVSGVGYYVYRNGNNHATVYGSYYLDRDTPNSKTPYTYTYGIQAFNAVGLSKVTASVSVTLCGKPK